ncbi:lactococcin 972 family bacteriocin [Streptomyces sp. Ru62]|uniref:lactococcin 972 family bacteriocin n=1 Tax=unclassified Streptomyces TaxID=2593676 RepID=UPI000CDE02FD|nr:lactococcin 972 family bacteriocin [Streptomyces sp. Ru62]POX63319.1 lactococcin 972 family bacteriocin [Streptomyces sp. Ru62]
MESRKIPVKNKRSLKVAIAAGALVIAGATPALATISYPAEGGTWDHGAGTSYVWSDYYLSSRCHGSTSVGEYIDTDEASAGNWSITQADAALYGNKAYYKTSC